MIDKKMNAEKNMTKGDVLIVDDNLDNLSLLTEMLTKNGYKVRPASSGALALTSIQSILPDFIIVLTVT